MKNSFKKVFGWAMILSLVLLGFPTMPRVGATDSLSEVRNVISSSTPEAENVTHTFDFTTGAALSTDDRIDITFPSGFTGILIGGVTCPGDSIASVDGQLVRCTVDSAIATGTHQVVVEGVTNPSKSNPVGVADTYQFLIETTNSDGSTVFERANAMVAIIEAVTVTATVDATLSFSISGLNEGQSIKDTTTNVTSTTTTIPFGTLPIGSSVVAAQSLSVLTNASDGYSVVVFQDGNLTSAAGDEISCFEEGTCVSYTAPDPWSQPNGDIDEPDTYGHFGFTSEDQGVAATCQDPDTPGYYGLKTTNLWAGFSGTDQATVMCHTGPADGSTEHKGTTRVGYRIEITAMQAAGDYTNTLTYIATPVY